MPAIFYMHQTSGACAGVCECDHMHPMDKSVKGLGMLLASQWV